MYMNTSINTHVKNILLSVSHISQTTLEYSTVIYGNLSFPKTLWHFKNHNNITITYNHPQAIFPGEVFTHRTATTLTITKPPLCINICDPITLNYSELTNIPSVYELSSVCNQCICVTTDVAKSSASVSRRRAEVMAGFDPTTILLARQAST